MKAFLKAIVLTLTISLAFTEDSGKLFDLNSMYEQGTISSFLAVVGDGYPITLGECSQDNPIFKVTQKAVDPPALIKGQGIRIKVGGVMTQDTVVSKLHLDTFFNGKVIYTNEVDKKNAAVPKGKWAYDYEASVPTFTPAGHWEIFIYIVDNNQKNISCIKAMFDTD